MSLRVTMETSPSLQDINPYLGLIFRDPVMAEDVTLHRRGPFSPFIRGDIYHMHWPDHLMWLPKFHRVGASIDLAYRSLILGLDRFRSRGGKVVWTAHNLAPHDIARHRLGWVWQRWEPEILSRIDAVIAMSPSVEKAVRGAHPVLQNRRFDLIPHPHYRQIYQPFTLSKAEARRRMGLPQTGAIIGSLGLVRRYKDPIGFLLAGLAAASAPHVLLAGSCYDDDLRRELLHITKDAPNVTWIDRELSLKEYVAASAACDLMVFNFARSLNSGSIYSALSLNRPALAPNKGAAPDIAAQVGRAWMSTFDGDLTAAILDAALNGRAMNLSAEMPDLAVNEPALIAAQHIALYNDLGTKWA